MATTIGSFSSIGRAHQADRLGRVYQERGSLVIGRGTANMSPAPTTKGFTVAQKVQVLLVDDVDGTEASESVSFGFDGTTYELDLSEKNAKKLRDELGRWIKVARKTGGTRRPTKSSSNLDLKAVRAWAASNKIELSNRGRVPANVIEQYKAAGN